MIAYIIITTLFILIGIASSIVFYRKGINIGKKIKDDEFKEHINQGKGKYGILIYYSYSSVSNVIEVEELESAGDLTKVRVINVCSNAGNKNSDEQILESKSFNEWVDTKKITWFSDNSQRLRDEKIKELLGDKSGV
jgi:hypothetical protein